MARYRQSSDVAAPESPEVWLSLPLLIMAPSAKYVLDSDGMDDTNCGHDGGRVVEL